MKYRLQKVLDLRAAQEKAAQQELAVRRQDYQAILSRIDRLAEDEGALFELIKGQERCGIDLRRLRHLYTYSEELKREFLEQEQKRQESLALVEQQREAVKDCWQKRRMLEILKSKAAAVFMKTVQMEEQKQLDELVLFSYAGGREKETVRIP